MQPGGFQGAQQTELQSRCTAASNEIIVKSETVIDSDRANARDRHHRGGKGIRKIDGRTIDIVCCLLDATNGKQSIVAVIDWINSFQRRNTHGN